MFKHEWLEKLERMFTGRSVEVARYKLVLERVGPDEFEARREGDLLFAGTLDRMAGWLAQRKQGNFLLSVVAAMVLAALLFAGGAYSSAHAQSPATSEIPAAVVSQAQVNVCKVTVPIRDGSNHIGSGIYLGDRLILTAEHVVRGGDGACDIAFADPTNNRTYIDLVRGRVLTTDGTWDQAGIELERLPKHNPPGAPMASANPRQGDHVTFVGYPHGRDLEMTRGSIRGFQSRYPGQHPEWFAASAPVVSGYSGGAAFNYAGELCGNLWGSDRTTGTVAACTGRTQRFLLPWNARLAAWRLAIASGNARPMQWQNCPPGQICQPRIVGPGDPNWSVPPGQGVPMRIEPESAPGSTPVPSQPLTPQPPPIDVTAIQVSIAKIEATIERMEARIDGLDTAAAKPSELSEADVNRIVAGVVVSI